jgi:RHS repeat-associated protein
MTNKMTTNNMIHRCLYTLVASLIVMGFADSGSSQDQSARAAKGTGGMATQISGNVDNINLQNGNVSLQIPLASLPALAGGKLSYTLSAYYNSKLWMVTRKEEKGHHSYQQGCDESYTTETVTEDPHGGWKIGGMYGIEFRPASEAFDYYVADNNGPCFGNEYTFMQGQFFKPILVMPDGSEHEMRIDGTYATYPGDHDYLKNYYRYQSGAFPSSSTLKLYTIDGTYIAATFEPTGDYKIYLKDGTIIESATGGQRIKDTNGNSILLTGSSATDEYTGREIKWATDVYGGVTKTKVEYQSVGGTWQSVWVVWGTTTTQGQLYKTKKWDSLKAVDGATCNQHVNLTRTLDVVRDIIFPETAFNDDPEQYSFEYNSDSSQSMTTSNVVLQCVGSPAPQSYTRDVTGLGNLSKMTMPSGAQYKYSYNSDPGVGQILGFFSYDDDLVADPVIKKEIVHDGQSDIWTYDIPASEYHNYGSVTSPDGSTYTEYFNGSDTVLPARTGTDGFGGLTVRSTSNRAMTEKHWILNGGNGLTVPGVPGHIAQFNPVVDIEYTSILDTSGNRQLMTARKFDYDYNGEITQTTEYDWFDPSTVTFATTGAALPTGIPSGATIKRVTNNTYYNDAANVGSSNAFQKRTLGTSPVILGKVKETTVSNGTTVKSRAKFYYDGHTDMATAPTLGNLSKTSAYNDQTSSYIDTLVTYDINGNITSTTDPNNNTTLMTYDSIGGHSNLYPTQTVTAYGTSVARTSTATYDFSTGLQLTATDADNSITTETDYDALLRPVKTKNAVGIVGFESWVVTEYHDNDRFVVVKSDIDMISDGKKVATQFYDMLGRVRLSKTLENAATQSATNETDGIKVETKYLASGACSFDAAKTCSAQLTSNPFRADYSSNTGSEPTMGWTLAQSRNDGRHNEVETFTGSALPKPFVASGGNIATTGAVKTEADANITTVTDQSGKVRRSLTNGIGQLVRVDEPTSGGLGPVTGPNQPTAYTYDVLNNLLTVTQAGSGIEQCGPNGGSCSQARTFTYSSLSRLLTATNPESGTISYGYGPNGNLTSKTDARGIVTSYIYDQLNRVTHRNYTNEPSGSETPDVSYFYGTTAPAIGKLTKVESSVSTTEYTSFDILGRVTSHKQTTDGGDSAGYATAYTYKLDGSLDEETYPSTRVVKNVLDANGDLSIVKSREDSNHLYWNYAQNFVYNAAGAVTSMELGNGLWQKTVFNSRLQPTQIGLGATVGTTGKLQLDYSYGTTQNNGNVQSQTITVPGMTYQLVQNYSYDSVNRLTSSVETSNSTQTWKQEFSYDRFGNRNFVTGSGHTDTLASCTTMCNPSFNTSNNRINSTGYSFDNGGNTTADPSGQVFTYDGENKQVLVTNGNGTVGQYWYDGDGKRVKKYIPAQGSDPGETTVFVYDAAGKEIAEYSTIVANSTLAQVNYLTADHLGSPRINTDQNGAVTARHDYMPFGEEIGNVAGRNNGDDSVRKQFTGYERDAETNLDFAEARYFKSIYGRFTSVDPLVSGSAENPQTFNRYSYVLNNPYAFTDPLGLEAESSVSPPDCPRYYEGCTERDGKYYWVSPDGIETEIDPSVLQINSPDSDSGVIDEHGSIKHSNGPPTMTVVEALHQQADRQETFILNNVFALGGHLLGRAVSGIGRLLFGSGANAPSPPPTTSRELPGLSQASPPIAGLGSTGPSVPANLSEQLAMESVRANPAAGQPLRKVTMNDFRWPASGGWVKMSRVVNGIEIHYVMNTITGAVDDFKFK